MPNDDVSDIGPIDLKALSPQERTALKDRIIRRARAERAQALGAIFGWCRGRLRDISRADTAKLLSSARMAASGHAS